MIRTSLESGIGPNGRDHNPAGAPVKSAADVEAAFCDNNEEGSCGQAPSTATRPQQVSSATDEAVEPGNERPGSQARCESGVGGERSRSKKLLLLATLVVALAVPASQADAAYTDPSSGGQPACTWYNQGSYYGPAWGLSWWNGVYGSWYGYHYCWTRYGSPAWLFAPSR